MKTLSFMKPDTYVPDTGVVTSCYYVSLPTYSSSFFLLSLSFWLAPELTFTVHRSYKFYCIAPIVLMHIIPIESYRAFRAVDNAIHTSRVIFSSETEYICFCRRDIRWRTISIISNFDIAETRHETSFARVRLRF